MAKKYVFLAVIVLTGSLLLQFGTAQSRDWQVTTAYWDLPEVSGLQVGEKNSVYATFETRQNDGQIVSLSGDIRTVLVVGLQKPDGLTTSLGRLIYTHEFGHVPVFELHEGVSTRLFDANGAEGVDSTLNGDVFIVEDRVDGRVLKFDRQSGAVVVLASGLEEAEGVCAMESGDVFFTEKLQGEVFRIRQGVTKLYLSELQNPGYLHCDETTQSIWITEDRSNFGRLLHSNGPDEYSVVATGLKSPQSIVFTSIDSFLLAEQGRNRILLFQRTQDEYYGFDWADFNFALN